MPPKKRTAPARGRGCSTNTRASVSRILFPCASTRDSAIDLGPRSRAASIDLPAGIGRAALFPSEDGSPGLFGLSAHGVYQAGTITGPAVVSYFIRRSGFRPPRRRTPPFHPCPPKPWRRRALPMLQPQAFRLSGGLLSVALSVVRPSPAAPLPVRKHGALCCPDFPPLPPCGGRSGGAMRGMSRNGRPRGG